MALIWSKPQKKRWSEFYHTWVPANQPEPGQPRRYVTDAGPQTQEFDEGTEVCMCGEPMDNHGDPMDTGHNPVSMADHYGGGRLNPNEGDTDVNHSKAIFLFSDKVRAVHVDYEGARTEQAILAKTMDPDIKVGDFVITPTDTRHKMTVVKVVAVDVDYDINTPEAVNWIIGKVDRADYEALAAAEQQAIATMRKAEQEAEKVRLRELMFKGKEALVAQLGTIVDVKALPAPAPAPKAGQ